MSTDPAHNASINKLVADNYTPGMSASKSKNLLQDVHSVRRDVTNLHTPVGESLSLPNTGSNGAQIHNKAGAIYKKTQSENDLLEVPTGYKKMQSKIQEEKDFLELSLPFPGDSLSSVVDRTPVLYSDLDPFQRGQITGNVLRRVNTTIPSEPTQVKLLSNGKGYIYTKTPLKTSYLQASYKCQQCANKRRCQIGCIPT